MRMVEVMVVACVGSWRRWWWSTVMAAGSGDVVAPAGQGRRVAGSGARKGRIGEVCICDERGGGRLWGWRWRWCRGYEDGAAVVRMVEVMVVACVGSWRRWWWSIVMAAGSGDVVGACWWRPEGGQKWRQKREDRGGWAYAFHQDKASLVIVPVANVTLSSLAHLLRENTNSFSLFATGVSLDPGFLLGLSIFAMVASSASRAAAIPS
nr:hypothetical protein [Tanacetum cinerariifolium]